MVWTLKRFCSREHEGIDGEIQIRYPGFANKRNENEYQNCGPNGRKGGEQQEHEKGEGSGEVLCEPRNINWGLLLDEGTTWGGVKNIRVLRRNDVACNLTGFFSLKLGTLSTPHQQGLRIPEAMATCETTQHRSSQS